MEKMSIKILVNVNTLTKRVDAMAEYLAKADVGDEFAEKARSIGEIDPSLSFEFVTNYRDGTIFCEAIAVGDLAALLHEFDNLST